MAVRKRAVQRRSKSGLRRRRPAGATNQASRSQGGKAESTVQRARQLKPLLSPADMHILQRSLGNQAVLRMMSGSKNGEGGLAGARIERAIQSAQGQGKEMPPAVQAKMEKNFGADFSGVEIHNDAQSDRLNDKLAARAFTSGSQIFFKGDQYRPETAGGQRLLAHELTHVVQQRAVGLKAGTAIHRSALADKNPAITPVRERPLIQGSFFKRIGNAIGEFFKGVKRAFKFVRNRLKQSCGGKIDAKESKNILEQVFDGKKFKVNKIKIVDEAGIKKAWDKIYGKGSYDGSNGQEADGPLEGFTAPDNTIYINSSAQEVDTMPHEILHRHENGAVINKMGENFNEGFTEYLTQKAVSAMGYKPTSSYPDDLAVVKKMVPIIGGDEVLEKAYFDGELDTLKKAFEKKKGAGTFDLLVRAMKAGNYGDANKIVDAKDVK